MLSQIPTSDYKEFINYATHIEENYQEDFCFICQEDDVEEISVVSTADDYTIKFKLESAVTLHPNKLSKVQLKVLDPCKLRVSKSAEVILLGNELPDTVCTDHSLVTISDNCCTPCVNNITD